MRSGGPPSPRLRRARSSLHFALPTKRRLERVTRLELATSSLARRCSTTELHPRKVGSNNRSRLRQRNIFSKRPARQTTSEKKPLATTPSPRSIQIVGRGMCQNLTGGERE